MRKIEEYRYSDNEKYFMAGEMSVEQYERLARDSQGVFHELLTEFNDKAPELTENEYKEWSSHILSMVTRGKTPSYIQKQGLDDPMQDFHISVGAIMRHLHLSYSDIMKMPARVFMDFLEDLPIILGEKEYDPRRRSERIDGEAIRGLKGEL